MAATPTTNTRIVAHAAVGVAATIASRKLLRTGGGYVLVAAFLVGVILHEILDAPVAQFMASLGLQL
jgi:hypothetical protein